MAMPMRFGSFFRAKRNGLGLRLREFCRRNGLDPGNISRLERGILAPPRSAEILDSYAKALKLNEAEEQTFSDLAAAETGVLPKDAATNAAVREALPRVLRTLRGRTRRIQSWTNRLDLESWARSIEARSLFPRLIRRLIHATVTDLQRIEFPAGEGAEKRGWDGLVDASQGNSFVPPRMSGWELGVGSNPAKKAEEEFEKRTTRPLGVTPAESTFVFVTPTRWEKKGEWEEEKTKLGKWREVRVYDSDSLEAWIELAPAVDVWLATLLGKRTEGMLDVDGHWKNLSALTEPKLTPEVFLTSRDKEIEYLQDWLRVPNPEDADEEQKDAIRYPNAPSALAIEALSPAEAIDFVSAYVATLSDETRDALASRIVIVADKPSWSILVDEPHPLILAVGPSLQLEGEAISEAVRKGHRVLLSSDRFATGNSGILTLPRANVYSLNEALEKAGFDSAKAQTAALDSGGSLAVLKRRLSRFPETIEPRWSREETAAALAPLTLLGSWDGSRESDRKVVADVVGCDYSQVAALLPQVAAIPDPLLFSIQGIWSLASREDSWVLLARYLQTDHFERWEKVAGDVLTAGAPTLDRSEIARHVVGLTDERRPYSDALRTGIAESLAILGSARGSPRPIAEKEAFRVARIVEKVLANAGSWRIWESLGPQLPLLAEASPDAFLSALEAGIRKKDSHILKLFVDRGDPPFSSCRHSGLLWALETIAWSTAHLLRVGLVLAELAERDTGARWANRPKTSLMQIFLPWLPHTGAGIEERIRVVRKITAKRPVAGWNLLIALLSSRHSMSTPTHRPKWRDWASNWRKGVTNADYWRQVQAISERLLEIVEDDPSRFGDLILHMEELPSQNQNDLIRKLVALNVKCLEDHQRIALATELRGAIRRHKTQPDAKWALPEADVGELEKVLTHVAPEDPIARNVWLFANYVELPEPMGETRSKEKYEEKVGQLRHVAISEIFSEGGLDAVLRLAQSVPCPWSVGWELFRSGLAADYLAFLPSLLVDPNPAVVDFARGYADGSLQQGGWEWVEKLPLKSWSGSQIASLALMLPADKRTWDLLGSHNREAVETYWNSIGGYCRIMDPADIEHCVSTLLRIGRPLTAMRILEQGVYNKVQISPELVLKTLEAAAFEAVKEAPTKDVGQSAQHLIQTLQEHAGQIDEARLAGIEWAYIHLLDGYLVKAVTLHHTLATNPKFFADLLALVFRSNEELERPSAKPTAQDRIGATNAIRLLHSWKTIPGASAEAKWVDADALSDWVEKARGFCRQSGHLEVCDSHVGEVLAHSPNEEDGTWPCIPVRDLLEDIESSELSRGFVIGTLNKRDVTIRSPFDGGNLERREADRYGKYATACESEWPRTAAALRSIADRYEHDARHEDDEAESERLGR